MYIHRLVNTSSGAAAALFQKHDTLNEWAEERTSTMHAVYIVTECSTQRKDTSIAKD